MTIKRVYINETNKEGEPYTNKRGEKYARGVLQLEDGRKPSKCLYTRDEIERAKALEGKRENMIEITANGEYLNWEFVDMDSLILKRIEALEAVVFKDNTVKDIVVEERSKIDVSDLPFN